MDVFPICVCQVLQGHWLNQLWALPEAAPHPAHSAEFMYTSNESGPGHKSVSGPRGQVPKQGKRVATFCLFPAPIPLCLSCLFLSRNHYYLLVKCSSLMDVSREVIGIG